MIRVGFILNFGESDWLGGINYYRNLINAICSNKERKIKPVVFTGYHSNTKNFEISADVEIIKNHMLDSFHPYSILRRIIKKIFHKDFLLERLLKNNDISVLSHYGELGNNSKVPTIGWIPDFQHKYLPDFFPNKEVLRRDKKFERICEECTRVIFSSNTVKNDAIRFYPDYAIKYRVLHFVTGSMDFSNLQDFNVLKEKYKIPHPYYFVPNQFWIHKNHTVILEALKILKSQGTSIFVIATGNLTDYRQPDYYKKIQNMLKIYEISENFKILGIVPYQDLLQLMMNSIAVINPSLFEGWSTSVEEAKTLNLDLILSDIPVHREQNPPNGIFFPPHDSQKLAEILSNFQKKSAIYPNINSLDGIIKKIDQQKKAFAQNYEQIVLDTYTGYWQARKNT